MRFKFLGFPESSSLDCQHFEAWQSLFPGQVDQIQFDTQVSDRLHGLIPPILPSAKSQSYFQKKSKNSIWLGPEPVLESPMSHLGHLYTLAQKLGMRHLALTLNPVESCAALLALLRQLDLSDFFVQAVTPCEAPIFWLKKGEVFPSAFEPWWEGLRRHHLSGSLMVMRHSEGARWIELPWVRFQSGRIHFFPNLDLSLNFQGKSIVQICPAPNLSQAAMDQMESMSILLAQSIGWVGLGNFRFLVDDTQVSLMGASPGLSPRFPLVQSASGMKLLEWDLAARGYYPNPPVKNQQLWAMSFHLRAQDPWRMGLAQAGALCVQTDKGGVLWEPGPIHEGVLAQVSSVHSEFQECLYKLKQNLEGVLAQGSFLHNQSWGIELLAHPFLREGIFHAQFLDQDFICTEAMDDIQAFLSFALYLAPNTKGFYFRDLMYVPTRFHENIWSISPKPDASGFWIQKKDKSSMPEHAFAWRLNEGLSWVLHIGSKSTIVRVPSVQCYLQSQITGNVDALWVNEGQMLKKECPVVSILSPKLETISQSLPSGWMIKQWLIKSGQDVTVGQNLATLIGPSKVNPHAATTICPSGPEAI